MPCIFLKASRLAAMIRLAFCTRDKDLITKIFTVFVRPLLEYASQVWNHRDVGHCAQLARIAYGGATRRLIHFWPSKTTYDERLRSLVFSV